MFKFFRKNKELEEISTIEKEEVTKDDGMFGSKNYQMKESYAADELFVGKFRHISSEVTSYGPKVKTGEMKYFFEQVVVDDEIEYREIFTGFITSDEEEYFDVPCVIEIEKYTDYFPTSAGVKIPKLSLMLDLNEINFDKTRELEKTFSKKN